MDFWLSNGCFFYYYYLFHLTRHARLFCNVHIVSGKLFLELNQFKEKFRRWIAPSLVNLDSLFERKLNDVQDWDIAFQTAEKTKKDVSNLSGY